MFLQRRRIALGLLQNTLHDRILQNLHDLRILLDAFHRLLFRFAGAACVLGFVCLLSLRIYFTGIGAGGVVFVGFVADVDAFAVLLHGEEGLCFAEVSADEVGVFLDGGLAVRDRGGEGHEFDESCCTIGVASRIVGGSFRHFRVRFHGCRPVGLFEVLAAEFAGFLGEVGADVGFLRGDYLSFFGGAEFVEDVGCAVLGQRFLVVGDGGGEVIEFFV